MADSLTESLKALKSKINEAVTDFVNNEGLIPEIKIVLSDFGHLNITITIHT